MTAKVKSVLTVAAEALETAAGYALVAVGIYAAVFIDVTGGGSLWKTMRHMQDTAQEGVESPNATRVIKVPTQVVAEKVPEDRMLAVFDTAEPKGEVAAVYQDPDAIGQRPSAAFTDTPAEPTSGKTWKRGLSGELRKFTVYGPSEQTTSASVSSRSVKRGSSAQAPAGASAPAAVEGSAARTETAAASRPGMGSRLTSGALSGSDTSRNVR